MTLLQRMPHPRLGWSMSLCHHRRSHKSRRTGLKSATRHFRRRLHHLEHGCFDIAIAARLTPKVFAESTSSPTCTSTFYTTRFLHLGHGGGVHCTVQAAPVCNGQRVYCAFSVSLRQSYQCERVCCHVELYTTKVGCHISFLAALLVVLKIEGTV